MPNVSLTSQTPDDKITQVINEALCIFVSAKALQKKKLEKQ